MTPESKKSGLQGLLERKKVLICCGSGGVGKTTTSAALALYASSIGYKTIFAVGMALFLITFVINFISIRLVRRYRQVYE